MTNLVETEIVGCVIHFFLGYSIDLLQVKNFHCNDQCVSGFNGYINIRILQKRQHSASLV